ncbi:uncharacterized protein BX663DRAFT_517600 [Cokeromyces recurvatus]|uniref:uncharacterized protein n=1 Tax=Cokeromyces recurvatus TaxID=90255 RepID=UPI00221E395F|nr:uncharacterized protein BX663DRAFT_517600 [Cokeromyces recurvatus]KAI7900441.1 hypothetical protein BX663DRAFT_517600 [Cokeromyces recurvatus]
MSRMSELIERLKKIAEEEQLIKLELQSQNLEEAYEIINAEGSKRKSNRVENIRKQKKIAKVAVDKIRIKGLNGTIGSNLIRLADEIVIKDKRSQYFSYLSRNSILDISNNKKNSQVALLGGAFVKGFLKKYEYPQPEPWSLPTPFNFEKCDGTRSLLQKYKEIDIYQPRDEYERILKRISVHILYPFAYNISSLEDNYLKQCSEQTLLVRYWANLFEYYFSTEQNVFLQWGDTISLSCKQAKLLFKLDIRLISKKHTSEMDVANGEVASVASSTKSKYYIDALKLTLSSKQHLNDFVSSLPLLTAEDVVQIKMPIIQILGMNCHISCLQIVDKNVYFSQDIFSFSYPKTIKEVKKGAINNIITGLDLIKVCISTINTYVVRNLMVSFDLYLEHDDGTG